MVMKNKQKQSDIVQWLLSSVIVLVLAVLSSLFFTKFDLTQEKRHSLTDASKEMLAEVDDVIFVRVYLNGTFPAKWKRLQQSIKEALDEFRDYSGDQIEYEFIDIYESGDEKTIGENEKALWEQGLRFTNIFYEENGAKKYQNIWPAAMITYKGENSPVQFYKSENPDPSDEMINNSVSNLEFELASKIRNLMRREKPSIAFLDGHGELEPIETADWTRTLNEDYDVTTIRLDNQVSALTDKLEGVPQRQAKYDLLIVAKPDSIFSYKDKLLIDQYIMSGGKVLWLIDPILTDLDSLAQNQQTIGLTNEMGLYDMLFDYGVKLNRNMVLDYQSDLIFLDAGRNGNQRNYEPFNWYYAPVVLSTPDGHPISAKLDPIRFDFASSLDFVGNDPRIQKTPLLKSSALSRIQNAPVRINTAVVNFDIDYFTNTGTSEQNLAVLLEGTFTSNFKDRLVDTLKKSTEFAFRERSADTKMIVIADGDIARNKVMPVEGGMFQPLPLGYDRNARRVVFDNKDFLMNCVNYLLDDEALISLRSRTIELRKLDQMAVVKDRGFWQGLNMVIPLILVALLGIINGVLRKRKYTAKAKDKQ
jgi:ABC-2 type transport system permease protein